VNKGRGGAQMLTMIRRGLIADFFAWMMCAATWGADFTLQDAKDLANQAAALIEKEGMYRAWQIFHDPKGGFISGEKGEIYVFVLNFNGDLLVHPRFDIEGRNALDWEDPEGSRYVREMIAVARNKGEGWVQYLAWDPKSEEVRPKVTFVTRVGKTDMLVGAGVFAERGSRLAQR
jgi:cytochrome c